MIDDWRRAQEDLPSRAEAVRQLCRRSLTRDEGDERAGAIIREAARLLGELREQDLYYLRSIKRNLEDDARGLEGMLPSIGSEVLHDNINWLDSYIDRIGPRLVPTGTSNPSEAGFDSPAGHQAERTRE